MEPAKFTERRRAGPRGSTPAPRRDKAADTHARRAARLRSPDPRPDHPRRRAAMIARLLGKLIERRFGGYRHLLEPV
ncbi:MAG: hypothetical protein R6X02_09620, partial [Enhygromyxa sp.]